MGGGGGMPSEDPGISGGGEMARQGGGGGVTETGGGPANPNAAVVVRWQSALPVRQAIARKQMLLGKIDQEKADAALKTAPNVYAVALSGLPMPLMRQALAAPDKVKSVSFLRPGRGEPIPAQQWGQSRAAPGELLFIFPRTSNISLDDKNVEFETALGPLRIKKKFAIKDLVFDGKPEM